MRRNGFGAPHRTLEARLAAVLCYLFWMMGGIIMLTVERKSRFVRFHALQSILFGAVVVVTLVAFTLAGLPRITSILGLVAVGVWLFLIYRAALGEWFHLPGLGWLAERNA